MATHVVFVCPCTPGTHLAPFNFTQNGGVGACMAVVGGASAPPCPKMPLIPHHGVGARHGASAPMGDCRPQQGLQQRNLRRVELE